MRCDGRRVDALTHWGGELCTTGGEARKRNIGEGVGFERESFNETSRSQKADHLS